MHFDFAALLVILTALSGVIWGFDRLLFASRRRARKADAADPKVVEYARAFFPVFLIVLVIRSFVAEPFRIPSSSMVPTLLVGDLILVNKFSYGLRIPVLETKFLDLGHPERGDVVVFRFPVDPSQDYIKRVIGLPGDRVTYKDRHVHINGERVNQDLIDQAEGLGADECVGKDDRPVVVCDLLLEQLPGQEHQIFLQNGTANGGSERTWIVPQGHYFVMGDNRDNSYDSRGWGFVPQENLVGKAFLVWMRLSRSGWGRIGTIIR